MGISSDVSGLWEQKNKHWVKWGAFIALIVLTIIGTAALSGKITNYFSWLKDYGYWGVFVGALIANASVIVPVPFMAFTLPLAINLASQTDPFSVSIAYAAGATLGEATSYFIGRGGKRIFKKEDGLLQEKAEKWIKKWGQWAIFILTISPFPPFDIVGITAGTIKYPFWKFLLFCFLGRTIKYFIIIWGGYEVWKLFD